MSPDTDHARQKRTRIERQRHLPFSKAVEISLKSIKVRFARSVLTVSSIVLAIAFLMWQLTSAEILRNLDDTASPKDEAGRPAESRVDRDAEPRRLIAVQLKTVADALKADTDVTRILDAFDTAQKRYERGVALARLEQARTDTDAYGRALAEATARLDDPAIKRIKQRSDDLEAQRVALQRRLQSTPLTSPAYKDLTAQIEKVKVEIEKHKRGEQTQYVKAFDAQAKATNGLREAQGRVKSSEEAAAAAGAFPDVKPAPEGSDELRRLTRARDEAKREKERADARVARAAARAESADNRYKAVTLKTLKQLLAAHGEQSADQPPVNLPLNLRINPARLWIIVLALLVYLVGITNAMLMSVTERYREIGTMKCLGALDGFIVKIFLLESSFMGIIGVVAGMVLGFVLSFAVQWHNFGSFAFRYFPGVGVLKWAGVAFVAGSVLTVLGGILPAQRAARMAPVEAMRIEERLMLGETIVRTKEVRKVYTMGKVEVEALRGITLEIHTGEYLSIMGPSGSGKTTLFNMIGALDKPSSGRVYINDVDVAQLDAYELAWLRCRMIGYIFQSFNIIPVMTALENVTLPMTFAGTNADDSRDKGMGLLKKVGLGERWNHKPFELSGGQQQRVAIARALANDPDIILADEPTGNLDLTTGKEIIELLREMNETEHVTIITATHDIKMLSVSDRVVRVRDGRIDRIEERSDMNIKIGTIDGEEE